jgi:hypothetical protein
LTVTETDSCVELTNVALIEIPLGLVTTAPESKFVPFTVAATFNAPWAKEFGVMDVGTGGGAFVPTVRQLVHMSATGGDPGSITEMFRGVWEALLATVIGTSSWVGETTVAVPAETPAPETKTFGVPVKPLPVS